MLYCCGTSVNATHLICFTYNTQKYSQTEQHRRTLQGLGIDPDLVATSDSRDEPDLQIPTGASKHKSADKESAFQCAGMFCDYYGEVGLEEPSCPHNMRDVDDESSSEEEVGEDDDEQTEDDSDMDM